MGSRQPKEHYNKRDGDSGGCSASRLISSVYWSDSDSDSRSSDALWNVTRTSHWCIVCPGSIDAIQGAIGAVCEAVDASVMATRGPRPLSSGPDDPCERAFVAVRPPGHHCGEDTPSGFCFINNVAVGAAHGMSLLVPPFLLTCPPSAFKLWDTENRNPRY